VTINFTRITFAVVARCSELWWRVYRSEKIGSMWRWCWIDCSYGSSRPPVSSARSV